MLTRASIYHYKSISEASLTFRQANVIVGPNGSGKSNILDAIYFLRDCAADDIDTAIMKRHGIDSLRQWSRTKPFNIIIDVHFENEQGSGSYKVTISSSKGNYRTIEEIGAWNGPHPRERYKENSEKYSSHFRRTEDGKVSIFTPITDLNMSERDGRVDIEQLFLTSLAGRTIFGAVGLFRPIADELGSFAKYNIYPNTIRNPQLVSRETTLAEDGANLSSVLKTINSNRRYSSQKENIISGLHSIMPNVIDFQVRSAAGYYVPFLRVKEESGDAHDFNLSQISDGTLRTLGLLCAFYQPSSPNKIGIEEPEQMIHPGALPVIHEAMSEFLSASARRKKQVFVTTHSPTFLDLFEPRDIIWAYMKKGVTEAGKVKRRQLEIIKQQLFTAGELLLAEGIF